MNQATIGLRRAWYYFGLSCVCLFVWTTSSSGIGQGIAWGQSDPPAETKNAATSEADSNNPETKQEETHAAEHATPSVTAHDAKSHGDSHDAHDTDSHPAGDHPAGGHQMVAPSLISVAPFVILLLGIALLPLTHKTAHWWENNTNKLVFSVACALIVLAYYGFAYGHGVIDHGTHEVSKPGLPAAITLLQNAILAEYIPFIALLFSLYVVSGGVNIAGKLEGTPATNTLLLAIGAVMASFVGTTGAAMVLIRPVIRANASREYVAHTIVFFIFIVCNTGGCLLPIGDPPLFLGYLRGVPFFWTLQLMPHWAMMNGILLVSYFAWDSIRHRHEKPFDSLSPASSEPFAIRGKFNFLLMACVIAAVALLDPNKAVIGTDFIPPHYLREGVMLTLVGMSLLFTSKAIREANGFNYDAIIEVAALFVGIFVCMQAPMQILNVHGKALGINLPWEFYWATGALSSFLDNAPTYVVFFETAKTVAATSPLVSAVGIGVKELAAISLGAVFMGAMTYIGNGPNLMVKAIAEKSNIRMPSFFGYMGYSLLILFPASVLLTLVFFR